MHRVLCRLIVVCLVGSYSLFGMSGSYLENGLLVMRSDAGGESGETVLQVVLPFGTSSEEREEEGVTRLMLHSLFYGTWEMDDLAIAQRLDDLGLDRDAEAHVMVGPLTSGIRFRMPKVEQDQLNDAMELLRELLMHPTLDAVAVSAAQRELGTSLSSQQVRNRYAVVVVPDGAVVRFGLSGVEGEVEEAVSSAFSLWPPSPRFAGNDGKRSFSLPSSIDGGDDLDHLPPVGESDVVIDEKIIMRSPSWLQTRRTSNWVGAGVALIGGCVFLGGVLFAPAYALYLAVSGLVVAGGSGYFFVGDFLRDPQVVASYRSSDLIQPFYQVYESGRAGITLTPVEGRARFLFTSIEARRGKSRSLPIYHLANLYELTDRVFLEITTLEERQRLANIRSEFIADKNLVKEGEQLLKRELNAALRTCAEERDQELQRLKEAYDENYYVRREKEERQKRDQGIEQANKDFDSGRSTEELRDEFIAQWEADYAAVVEESEFAAGLERASSAYKENKARVEKLYKEQEARVKNELNYDERLLLSKRRKAELYSVHDQRLRSYLTAWPEELPGLVDWRDLR